MTPEEVKAHIEAGLTDCTAIISGEGCNLGATVISPDFEGMSMIKEHKAVYKLVNDYIASGELHALTIKAYTPEEWEKIK
ncbi:unnamed protein product [Cyprideis torosa]|uniref:Uncharacterized protein n=1 Tax=Cyprideis torosa TaxID=163714 RepID=A0A7R8WXF0_9CRUS|nr:unnamed protein product [Cyprideis torosa]CAG0911941.1 unnamed protein product [Cyprideis torosa]